MTISLGVMSCLINSMCFHPETFGDQRHRPLVNRNDMIKKKRRKNNVTETCQMFLDTDLLLIFVLT